MTPNFDVSHISDDCIETVFVQAEEALRGTVAFSLAAQQRATTMVGILGATSTALLAAALAVLAGDHPSYEFVAASLTGSLMLLVAAVLCAWPARAINLFSTGYQPALLSAVATQKDGLRLGIIEDFQRRITVNRASLEKDARWFNWGLLVAANSLVMSVLIFFLVKFIVC